MASPGPGPFGNIQLLRNHWSGPARPRAYYWYLTFADDAAICDLAARSQQALALPYYDPVPPQGLHMTIGGIVPEGGITAAQLNSVSAAARLACQAISPFRISLGELSGTRGAIGFAVRHNDPPRHHRLRKHRRRARCRCDRSSGETERVEAKG